MKPPIRIQTWLCYRRGNDCPIPRWMHTVQDWIISGAFGLLILLSLVVLVRKAVGL